MKQALIIIVPLFGITYLITIVGPKQPTNTLATLFILTRNVLLSFQGFFITLPYCFLNSEVCTMIKSHFDRWRDRSNIGYGPASARNSIAMQGMFNVNDARKRSSFGYHNVTTTTMVDDKRGAPDADLVSKSSTNGKSVRSSHCPSSGDSSWRKLDGPLVAVRTPPPDLVQYSQEACRQNGENLS